MLRRFRRSSGMLLRFAVVFVTLAGGGWSGVARGEDNPPERENIVVLGDSQAQGIAVGLSRVLVEDPRYKVLNRTHPGAALVHAEAEWLGPVQKFVDREKADIAVVMFGANDRLDMRGDDGAYLRFRTDAWRDAYAQRIDRILTALHSAGLRVLWCGNPIARSAVYSADMGYINDIYAEETARFGAQFLPLWDAVTDDEGRFTAYGKDRDGVTQRLRNDDGIHFTGAGYELIADKIVAQLTAPAPPPGPTASAPGANVSMPGQAAATSSEPRLSPPSPLLPSALPPPSLTSPSQTGR